ncbi:Dynein light chain 1, cytoplasmic [Myotis davidii]|uniref:Dynein light chain n=1 Tax=Myotis davidii TaxID=225400 RepID=L5LD70_MYODS|nr:Dynein light chain 1, cytoplasmic [Myotis davidii]
MQQDSVECAIQTLEEYNIVKDISAHMKKEFNKSNSLEGRNFGSYLTHKTELFFYFYLGQVTILLFKYG